MPPPRPGPTQLAPPAPTRARDPKEQTGIVDLTRRNGKPRARLLDLVPGRSGKVYADWLRVPR